jgi:hypothetical protein
VALDSQEEVEVAKIFSEVFNARPANVELMLQTRLEERSRSQEYQDDLWPSGAPGLRRSSRRRWGYWVEANGKS